MSLPDFYLASSSPRRRELLIQFGLQFVVISQDVPEHRLPGESPEDYVQRLAVEKARAGFGHLADDILRPVLGADTTVVVDDDILGKPSDKAAALAMLAQLSGRSHRVLSAVAVVGRDDLGQNRTNVKIRVRISESRVTFRVITDEEREAYWVSSEPGDKAGAYAIQGLAAVFIERLEGSYSGVMGLPLFETSELLGEFGIHVL